MMQSGLEDDDVLMHIIIGASHELSFSSTNSAEFGCFQVFVPGFWHCGRAS